MWRADDYLYVMMQRDKSMTDTQLKILDRVLGIAIVGAATVWFVTPFALILFSPALGGL